jgi:hypothetical protein
VRLNPTRKASAVATLPEDTPTLAPAWCPECKKIQPVEDAYPEDTGDRAVWTEVYWVTDFACGHQLSVKTGEYRSPLQQAGPTRAASMPDPFEGQ